MDPLVLGARLSRLVAEGLRREGCDCLLYSGGVDTGFIAASHLAYYGRLGLGITVAGPGDPDYPYVLRTRRAFFEDHVFLDPWASKGYDWAVEEAALLLETIDPVEVASAAVLLLALVEAGSRGCRCVATGDGGDEVFLGYAFLRGMPRDRLHAWWQYMLEGRAWFQAPLLARELGLRVHAPLYSPEARSLAGLLPAGWHLGKRLLRAVLELLGYPLLARRPKTPVTSGSGALGRLRAWARGRPISTRPWLPSRLHAALQYIHDSVGTGLPRRCVGGRACSVCGSCLRGRHCPYCGAYHGETGVSVYTG